MARLDEIQSAIKAAEKEAEKAKAEHEKKIADLTAQLEQEQTKGPEVIALFGALKEVTSRLKAMAPELVPTPLLEMPGQQWPKEKYVGMKQYGLSETEVHNAMAKGRKAVDAL